jgi:hypothetical protein
LCRERHDRAIRYRCAECQAGDEFGYSYAEGRLDQRVVAKVDVLEVAISFVNADCGIHAAHHLFFVVGVEAQQPIFVRLLDEPYRVRLDQRIDSMFSIVGVIVRFVFAIFFDFIVAWCATVNSKQLPTFR